MKTKTIRFCWLSLLMMLFCSWQTMAQEVEKLPYTVDNFINVSEQWTIIDANNDNTTWIFSAMAACRTNSDKITAADDWFISPKFYFVAGVQYKIEWQDRAGAGVGLRPEKYSIHIGSDAAVVGMTKILETFEIENTSWVDRSVVFTVEETGNYHLGWHCHSDAAKNQLNIYKLRFKYLVSADLALVSISGDRNLNTASTSEFSVNVKNLGQEAASGFTVDILDEENNVMGSTIYSESLATETSVDIKVNVLLPESDEIHRRIKARVSINGDFNPNNNLSEEFDIKIFPSNIEIIYVGNPTSTSKIAHNPITTRGRNSASQSIYKHSDIDKFGQIIGMEYYTNFDAGYSHKANDIKIYFKLTSEENLASGWDMDPVLVYQDSVDLIAGKDLFYKFDSPFLLEKKSNLSVLNSRSGIHDVNFARFNFKITPANNYANRTISYYSFDSIPFDFSQTGTNATQLANTCFFIDTDGGELSGIVLSEGNPLEGIKIVIEDSEFSTITDAEGKYKFPFIPTGNYNLTTEDPRYINQSTTFDISAQETKTSDFDLVELEKVSITGIIKNTAQKGIANANVVLDGEIVYQTTSNASGRYTIENVYIQKEYKLNIYKSEYKIHESEIAVDAAIANNDIQLTECSTTSASNINVVEHAPTWYDITLNWDAATDAEGYLIFRNGILLNTKNLISEISFVDTTPGEGDYTYQVFAVSKDSCVSLALTTDKVEMTLYACDGSISSFPYLIDFEEGMPECWEQQFENLRTAWAIKDHVYRKSEESDPIYAHSGDNLIHFQTKHRGSKTKLLTAKMDLSGMTYPSLNYWMANINFGSGASLSLDTLKVYYRNSQSSDWILLKEIKTIAYNWSEVTIKLPNPSKNYQIAFEGISDYGYGVLLDDIMVLDDICTAVSNFKAEQVREKAVLLTWEKPISLSFKSYDIYRGGILIKTIKDHDLTEFVDDNLVVGGSYAYSIVVNYNKDCSQSEAAIDNVSVVEMCDSVVSLTLKQTSKTTVDVNWEAPNAGKITSYTLSRNGEEIATDLTETNYTDESAPRGKVSYGVIVNYENKDCTQSAETTKDINVICDSVSNIQVRLADDNKSIKLSWNGVEAFDNIALYGIFRDNALIGSTREYYFEDTQILPGSTYQYCIRARYDSGCEAEEACSETIVIPCKSPNSLTLESTTEGIKLDWTFSNSFKMSSDEDKVLFDNGPIMTHADVGYEGYDVSLGQAGMVGYNITSSRFYGIDNFVLAQKTHLSEIEFYVYVYNTEVGVIPLDAIYVRLMKGNPREGNVEVIFGQGDDITNNLLVSQEFAGIFRVLSSDLMDFTRPIVKVKAKIDMDVDAGEYYFLVGFEGQDNMYPVYAPPVTIINVVDGVEVHQKTTGDAYIYNISLQSFTAVGDSESGAHFGIPFKVYGSEYPELFNIYRDGELIAENVAGNTYTDKTVSAGTHTWEVRHVCAGGESEGVSETSTYNSTKNVIGQDVTIYPNPARNAVTVKGENIKFVEIYNSVGQLFERVAFSNAEQMLINLDTYSEGTYLFKLHFEDKTTIVRSVIVLK